MANTLIPKLMMNNYSVKDALSLTIENAEESLRDLERLEPKLWRHCYPRIYEDYKSNDYYSPKSIAHQMMCSILKVNMGYVAQSEHYELMWASQLAQYKVPTYWVTRDLIEAVMQTIPPIKLDWYNMPMPFPAASFMLPKGTLVHEKEGNARYISYNRCRAEENIPSIADVGSRYWASKNGSMVLWGNTDQKFLTHWNIPYDAFPVVDLADLDGLITKYETNVHSSGWLLTQGMSHSDTIFGAAIAHLIFGLLLLMTRKPSLVQVPRLLRSIKRKGDAPKEFWSPGVIGHNYKIKRIGQSLGGTHASPRGHWVRGFWREQLKGVGKTIREEVWIEPYWRGGEAI